MPKVTDTKVRSFIDETLPPQLQENLREKLGWSNYQWTWYLNNPRRWPAEKVLIFAAELNIDWRRCVRELDLGLDALTTLLQKN